MFNHDYLFNKYSHLFDALEVTPKGNSRGAVYFTGFDTEYEEIDKGRKNKIISYQVASFSREGYGEDVHITENGKRLTLKQVARMGLAAANGGKLPKNGVVHLNFIAHFSGAEGAALADRMFTAESMRVIRKSLVTKKAIKLQLGSTTVFVHLYDTKLIAPASTQSLEKLTELLDSPASQKLQLPDRYKARMSTLLRDDPELFKRYGLQDARGTLEAFLYLQNCLNQLAFGEFRRLFTTLGSASVAGFFHRMPSAKDYFEALRAPKFREAVGKMKQGFFGGLCMNYFVGSSRTFEPTRFHIIFDVDISSAYPVCMYGVPKVDVDGEPVILRTRYQMTCEVAQVLRDDGLDDVSIDELRAVLEETPSQLKSKVQQLVSGKKRAARVLSAMTVVDNQLVEKWSRHSLKERDEFGVNVDSYAILGCAYVRFNFPEGVEPTLAISHQEYGLQYVREGETLATAIEIVTAMEAGADIEALYSVEFPIARDEQGRPQFVLRDHLKHLVSERRKHPKKSVMNLLLKEMVNSFYGKLGQGINSRNVTELTGESRSLWRSPITDPVTAATVTGIARAGLSAMVRSIELFNVGRSDDQKVYMISATTDGMLLAFPQVAGVCADEFYEECDGELKFIEPDLEELLERLNCGGLFS